ncbi:MAG: hypothetical protein F2667_08265 [Actinobacteria bacterium]|uniref:Unannotated protein n=1 Tax=freshwater metagenome TaxID=449393 RepID=A0A6J6QMY9_9ZZZZ|nr:hypothetical protein [Actinomycetota bacterium]
MSRLVQVATMPAAAVLAVGAVLGVQLAHGGGSFEPLRPADACAARVVTSRADGIDALTERLVLIGLDDAACRLGISREALTLELAQPGARTEARSNALVDAVGAGLRAAVVRMQDDGTLPPASGLVDEALDSADLNGFVEAAIRAVPDSLVDAALKTDDVLLRAIDELDLRTLLSDLDDEDALDAQVEEAITQAVKDSLADRLRDLL